MSQPRRVKRLVFSLVAFGLALALVEALSYAALLVIAKQPDVIRSETHLFDAHRNHRLNPAFQLSDAPRDRLHAQDGLRQSQVTALRAPPQTVRVLVLGTSALYGIGARAPYPDHPPLANDQTITFHLERLLQERLVEKNLPYDVEVINAGVSAYHTFHHLVYLNSDLLAYRPDVVINLDGHNDFYADALHDRWNEYAYSTSILVDQYNGRSFYLSALTTIRAAAPYSNFFNLAERVFRRTWYRKVDQPLEHTPHQTHADLAALSGASSVGEQSFVRDLWQIHQLGEYAGYEHCVFLQPEVLLEDPQRLSSNDQRIRDITVEQTPPGRADHMQSVRRQLPAVFAEHSIPFHDVGELGPHREPDVDLYIDYCHLTPSGAELTAEQMLGPVFDLVAIAIAKRGAPAAN